MRALKFGSRRHFAIKLKTKAEVAVFNALCFNEKTIINSVRFCIPTVQLQHITTFLHPNIKFHHVPRKRSFVQYTSLCQLPRLTPSPRRSRSIHSDIIRKFLTRQKPASTLKVPGITSRSERVSFQADKRDWDKFFSSTSVFQRQYMLLTL